MKNHKKASSNGQASHPDGQNRPEEIATVFAVAFAWIQILNFKWVLELNLYIDDTTLYRLNQN